MIAETQQAQFSPSKSMFSWPSRTSTSYAFR